MKLKSMSLLILLSLIITGCGGGGKSGSNTPGTGVITGTISVTGVESTALQRSSLSQTKTIGRAKHGINSLSSRASTVANEKIVTFAPGLSQAEVAQIVAAKGGRIKTKLTNHTYLVSFSDQNSFSAFSTTSDIKIKTVQDNYIYRAMAITPVDPDYSNQWNMRQMFFPDAWGVITDASGVTVAVVDTGVDRDHLDLVANLITGRNFVNTTASDGDFNYDDLNGHGTHVAGIIGAYGIGVTGAARRVKIMPVRVLDANGEGNTATIIKGINWAVQNGANIINLSLGGTINDPALEAAINTAVAPEVPGVAGVTVIAAAGNHTSNYQTAVNYPARYTNVIAVAALDADGTVASYSNYGPEVDLCAPGGDSSNAIYSTLNNNTYGYEAGTSMACPHISGLAALLYASGVTTPDAIRTRLQTYVIDKGSWDFDNYYGHGMPDAYAVLKGYTHKTRNTRVFLGRKDGTKSNFIFPDDEGNFSITKIAAGTYYVCAYLDYNSNGSVDSGDKFGYYATPVNITAVSTISISSPISVTDAIPTVPVMTLSNYLKQVLPAN